MTHFTVQPNMVRADFYKPSGKWYMTEAIDMNDGYLDNDIHRAVQRALAKLRPELPENWYNGFTVVVQEPYHKNAYPVMLIAEELKNR